MYFCHLDLFRFSGFEFLLLFVLGVPCGSPLGRLMGLTNELLSMCWPMEAELEYSLDGL